MASFALTAEEENVIGQLEPGAWLPLATQLCATPAVKRMLRRKWVALIKRDGYCLLALTSLGKERRDFSDRVRALHLDAERRKRAQELLP